MEWWPARKRKGRGDSDEDSELDSRLAPAYNIPYAPLGGDEPIWSTCSRYEGMNTEPASYYRHHEEMRLRILPEFEAGLDDNMV